MALSERAAAAAPYVHQLLYDQEVQNALGGALRATRKAYTRGRGKNARQAVQDKQLWRQLQQAIGAVGELWSALGEPAPRRSSRRRIRLAAVAIAGAGGFLALNAEARKRLFGLLGKDPGESGDVSNG